MADPTLGQQNALDLLKQEFSTFGLGGDDFVKVILDAIIDNTDAQGEVANATVRDVVRKSEPYQKRFAGNLLREKKIQEAQARGVTPAFGVLSEAAYIQAEDNYRKVLRDAKLPANFYDDTAYLGKLIGEDLSINEVTSRAVLAQQAASQANPEIRQQLQAYYNISEDQITAFFLDPDKAKENIDAVTAGTSAVLGAAAKRGGMDLTQQQAEELSRSYFDQGIDVQGIAAVNRASVVSGGLTATTASGQKSTVTAEDVIKATTGDAVAEAKLEAERKKRLAEYDQASGMASSAEGVVTLRRANI